MTQKNLSRKERIMDHPHHVRQSISDWELEHREYLGQALEKGVTNLIEADEFLRNHMDQVDYGYLKELWNEKEGSK
jgi:hypothetical protein